MEGETEENVSMAGFNGSITFSFSWLCYLWKARNWLVGFWWEWWIRVDFEKRNSRREGLRNRTLRSAECGQKRRGRKEEEEVTALVLWISRSWKWILRIFSLILVMGPCRLQNGSSNDSGWMADSVTGFESGSVFWAMSTNEQRVMLPSLPETKTIHFSVFL